MVNVVNPPRRSYGPTKVQARAAEDEIDEFDSSQDDFSRPKDIKFSDNNRASMSSSTGPPLPAPILPSPVASTTKVTGQRSPSPQPEQQPGLTQEEEQSPSQSPSTSVVDDASPPPPSPLARAPNFFPLAGRKVVGAGSFNRTVFPQIKDLVLELGGEWPANKHRIDKSVYLVVLGNKLAEDVTTKIINGGMESVSGLKGLKAWGDAAHKQALAKMKPPFKFKAAGDPPIDLSFWMEDNLPASIRKDLTDLIASHGGAMESLKDADVRLVDPSSQAGREALAQDSRNDEDIPWRARPWHWVHACVIAQKFLKRTQLDSPTPVFVRPKLVGGEQLVCYIAKSLDRTMPYLAKRIRAYGGVLTSVKAEARVLIVDEDSKDNPSTRSIKDNYGGDSKKFIVPYQWVQKSISAGQAVVQPAGPKRNFTREEDELLPKFIALVIVGQEKGKINEGTQRMKRNGEKMYQYLCRDINSSRWPWASNHPPSSWRERYRNFKVEMDPIIDELCRKLRRKTAFDDEWNEKPEAPKEGQGSASGSASPPKRPNPKKRPRSPSPDPIASSPAPSPKRARTALASRERFASRAEKEIEADQLQEDDYQYPANDDNMAPQDEVDYGLREGKDAPPAAAVQAEKEEEPMKEESVVASVPEEEQMELEEDEYDEEDRRALAGSLRTTVEQVRGTKQRVGARGGVAEEEDGSDDDEAARLLEEDEEIAAALPPSETQQLQDSQRQLPVENKEDDEASRYFDDDEMVDEAGISGGGGIAEEKEEGGSSPVVEPAHIIIDAPPSSPPPAQDANSSRVTRSRSAVSPAAAAPSPSSSTGTSASRKKTANGSGATIVSRPWLGLAEAETVPHLEIEPRKRSRSNGSATPMEIEAHPQPPTTFTSTVSNALSSLASAFSPSKVPSLLAAPISTSTTRKISPLPRSASPQPISNLAPPPAPTQPSLSRSSSPAPPLDPLEKKRKQEAAIAWSLVASHRWSLPVLAVVQTLRQQGGDTVRTEQKLAVQAGKEVRRASLGGAGTNGGGGGEGEEHVWTEEEDRVVRRGTKEETRALQKRVGPLEFVRRLGDLRE